MLIEHGTWIWEKEVHFSVFQIVYRVYTKLPIKIDINGVMNKLCQNWDDQKTHDMKVKESKYSFVIKPFPDLYLQIF